MRGDGDRRAVRRLTERQVVAREPREQADEIVEHVLLDQLDHARLLPARVTWSARSFSAGMASATATAHSARARNA